MIEFKNGDIFQEAVEAVVNPVNCVGVMGKGLALQFKQLYPNNFTAYKQACAEGRLVPGKVFTFAGQNQLDLPRYILNFPTKRHWKDKSKIEDIESGLVSLVQEMKRLEIKSIAIPPLGCGLGGLKWADVKEKIRLAMADQTGCSIVVIEPE